MNGNDLSRAGAIWTCGCMILAGGMTGGAVASEARVPSTVMAKSDAADMPKGRADLFDLDDKIPESGSTKVPLKPVRSESPVSGYVQFEGARTVASPDHFTKLRTRAELVGKGALSEGVKWKAGVRLDYDAVYDIGDYYPGAVKRDQRFEASVRETYLDMGAGEWELRLGRQHVVWGEMVGLFFADVVSARDLREFILPEFDAMRIPQWAARAEYFQDDFHAELLWIPVASYDDNGKPGAEFHPMPKGASYLAEQRPVRTLGHGNYGVRLSTLKKGWDLSAFYYGSMDREATFYRFGTDYQARHDRIHQWGGTLAKDFGATVLKAEAVYTHGRGFQAPADPDGVVKQDILDWALGLDFSLPADTRFNVQFFQRAFLDYAPPIIHDRQENGYSLYLNKKLTDNLEVQVTWIASFNRTDWLLRPRLAWNFERNWRMLAGADIFKGPSLGLFGQYDENDRGYLEVRYSF